MYVVVLHGSIIMLCDMHYDICKVCFSARDKYSSMYAAVLWIYSLLVMGTTLFLLDHYFVIKP